MPNNQKRLYLISNMYPSPQNLRYGIFVKNFEVSIIDFFIVKKIVLTKQNSFLSKFFGYAKLYFQISSIYFKSTKKDLIYVHFPLHLAPAIFPLWFLKRKTVLNFHGSDLVFNSFFKKMLSIFLKPGLKKSYIVVPSNYYKEKLLIMFNIPSSKIFTYPSGGINKTVFYPNKTKYNNAFVMGFVSNFIEGKGWRVFLEAIKKIKAENIFGDFEILMAGDGPDKQEIQDRLLEMNVKFELISNLSQKELALFYNKMDVFIFPSFREEESLGLVGLEAMACGIPVIAAKTGGPMGYVEDRYNGFLFEKKDVDALVEKMILYYNFADIDKKKMSENAIKTANRYDSATVQKELIDFLKRIS